MLLREQKSADTLFNLRSRLLDALHHVLIRVGHVVCKLIRLLDLRRRQLDEGLSVEGVRLINCSIDEQIFRTLLDGSCGDESRGRGLGSELNQARSELSKLLGGERRGVLGHEPGVGNKDVLAVA